MSNVQVKAAEASAEVESVTNAVLIEPSEANAICRGHGATSPYQTTRAFALWLG